MSGQGGGGSEGGEKVATVILLIREAHVAFCTRGAAITLHWRQAWDLTPASGNIRISSITMTGSSTNPGVSRCTLMRRHSQRK